ncbi:hypothetical protein [Ruminiclostridium cellobioparum]|uniref:hypothetical protein n=1 Tax=Ruminiclostridium cellobioparum TaxID=29355 RepID=UPI0028ACCEC9|nr:hypothetical protein [Ruminiclostridium cellobioparum]
MRDKMYCITRNDMKFGEHFVPAGTKAHVIKELRTQTVDAPGVDVELSISLWDIKVNGNGIVLVADTSISNELEDRTSTEMTGIVVYTDTTKVYMDADARLYQDKELYDWQVEKIFPEGVPSNIKKAECDSRKFMLYGVINYLEDEFAEWVQNNCEFRKLTKEIYKTVTGLTELNRVTEC